MRETASVIFTVLLDQGKNPKWCVSSYFYCSFTLLLAPVGNPNPAGPIFYSYGALINPYLTLPKKIIISICENMKKPATSDSSLDIF